MEVKFITLKNYYCAITKPKLDQNEISTFFKYLF